MSWELSIVLINKLRLCSDALQLQGIPMPPHALLPLLVPFASSAEHTADARTSAAIAQACK